MWRLLYCWLGLSLAFGSPAQQPYELDLQKELGITGTSFGLLGGYFLIDRQNTPPSRELLEQLEPEQLWEVDRWVTQNLDFRAGRQSDWLLRSSFLYPVTLLASQSGREDLGTLGVITLETVLLNAGLTGLTKAVVKRPRPYLYQFDDPQVRAYLAKKSSRYSFFSGHTSQVASMSFLTATMWNDYNPDGNLQPVIWGVAAAIPAFTGWLRIKSGKHFVTDVLVGYVVGAAVGLTVPALHR